MSLNTAENIACLCVVSGRLGTLHLSLLDTWTSTDCLSISWLFKRRKRKDLRRKTYLGLIGVPSPESQRRWQQNLSHFTQKSQKNLQENKAVTTWQAAIHSNTIILWPRCAPGNLLPHPITVQITRSILLCRYRFVHIAISLNLIHHK